MTPNTVDWKTPEEIVTVLKKDCSKFLKEARGVFWRGSRTGTLDPRQHDIMKLSPRTDRQPRNTPKKVHDALDRYFLDEYGWKARSEGVFATRSGDHAGVYGPRWMIFPIGNYKYVWSRDIVDLFDEVLDLGALDYEEIFDIMDEFVYSKYDLADSGDSEVMFKCKNYYLINNIYAKHIADLIGWPMSGANITTPIYKDALKAWGEPTKRPM